MPNLDVDRLIRGWRGPLIAAFVALLAGLPGMLAVPVIDRDEARFAQATAQMLETGDYVDIRFQDQPRYKKPVGIHWLQAAAVRTFSSPEARQIWAYRLPSLLGVMIAAAACAWGAAAFFGQRTAVLAGAIYATTLLLTTEAHFAKTDAVLAALVTLAMAALGRLYFASTGGPPGKLRHKWIFWGALAASVLIKGPVGPMVAVLALVGLAFGSRFVRSPLFWFTVVAALTIPGWIGTLALGFVMAAQIVAAPLMAVVEAPLNRGIRRVFPGWLANAPEPAPDVTPDWIARLGWIWGLLLIVLVVGPWALSITIASDGGFWGEAVGHDFAGKLAGAQERHGGPRGYHLLGVFLWFYPATLLLPAAAVTAWTRRREPGVRFALAWLLLPWLVFELAPTKLPHYPLPIYGALAWLAAAALERPLNTVSRWVGVALGALAALAISLLAVVALMKFGDRGDVVWVSLTVGFALIGIAVAAFLLLNRAAVAALLVALSCGTLAHIAFAAGEAPNLKPFWTSRTLAKALKVHRLDPRQGAVPGPVQIAGYSEPSAVFRLGTDTGLGRASDAALAIAGGRPAVVETKLDKEFHAELAKRGLHARAVATVKGFNYARGKWVILTLYQATP